MGKCDADSGVLFSACLPVSQSLWSDARCCDAGSRVVSPACAPVSPSLCGQTPDAAMLTALNRVRKNEGTGQNQLNLFLLTQF